MKDIFGVQSKSLMDPSSSTLSEDFVIKCLREGYERDEIIKGISEFYRQSFEVAEEIFERAVLGFIGIKDKISAGNVFNLKRALK